MISSPKRGKNGDFQGDIMTNADDFHLTTSGSFQMPWIQGKVAGGDELVRYMHNLPSYLQRGENLKEKVLSVGVLEWSQLEKWQCNSKQILDKSSRSSPSSSNTSTFFTTDGSSVNSSREQSRSPSHQSRQRPTLQAQFGAFPKERYSNVVQTFGQNPESNQDLDTGGSSTSNKPQELPKSDSGFKLEQSVSQAELKTAPRCKVSSIEAKSCLTRKTRMQDSEMKKRPVLSQQQNPCFTDDDCQKRPEQVVLIVPKGSPRVSDSKESQLPGLMIKNFHRSTKASQGRYSEHPNFQDPESSSESSYSQGRESLSGSSYSQGRDSLLESSYSQCRDLSENSYSQGRVSSESSYSQGTHHVDFYYDTPITCLMPHSADCHNEKHLKKDNFSEARFNRLVSSRGKKIDENSAHKATSSTASVTSEGPGLLKASVTPERIRNLSRSHQFNSSVSTTSRISSSKEDSAIEHLSPGRLTAKSVPRKVTSFAASGNVSIDKHNPANRPRSSPLRRLLDPLVKPKAVNCRNIAEPLPEGLVSTDRTSKSSEGRLISPRGSVKVKLDLTGCRTVKVISSCQNENHKTSIVHALLKVVVKNGLPLFTLAVDNESDVIAATVRRLSSPRKDGYCWAYTFFTIREIKKKIGGWINQGNKDKRHGYVPNVVAQLKVRDSLFSNTACLDDIDEFRMKEFVLFSVDQSQADQQSSGIQPDNELGAIVIKIPREIHDRGNHNHVAHPGLRDYLAEENSLQDKQNGFLVGNENLFGMTAILPNGVHSLPSNGGPSSLIHRWKSGGSCDCGGWDLGCKLRVLTNETCLTTDRFDLSYQDEALEKQPVFTLAPFRDGIYSVAFHASLSHLQAFSICIAVLEGKKPFALLQQNNFLEETNPGQTTTTEYDRLKAFGGMQGEIPAKYVSYPPLSPAGRV